MLSYRILKILNIFCHTRGFCCPVSKTPKDISCKSLAIRLMSQSKKRTKKKVVIKRVSDDIEAIWLENLTSYNLRLYRKTSFGSFRKINLQNLLLRLKEIYPTTFEQESEKIKISTKPEMPEPENEEVNASPCLSEFLIKNIVDFPLLKTKSPVSEFAEVEAENFGDVDVQTFPSVSKILSDTMSPIARLRLKQWKMRLISELGEEGFLQYQQDLLSQGSKLHSTLKTYLEVLDKSLVTVDPRIEGCWKSLEKLLSDITDVVYVEESLYHPVLMYKGIVDCVAHYRGTPCVIEWKRSTKAKSKLSSTYDAPLQLCAYLGALSWHKKVTIENGLVVVAYTDGTPADVFEMSLESCQVYWVEWLRRVQSYWLKKSPTIVRSEIEL